MTYLGVTLTTGIRHMRINDSEPAERGLEGGVELHRRSRWLAGWLKYARSASLLWGPFRDRLLISISAQRAHSDGWRRGVLLHVTTLDLFAHIFQCVLRLFIARSSDSQLDKTDWARTWPAAAPAGCQFELCKRRTDSSQIGAPLQRGNKVRSADRRDSSRPSVANASTPAE